MTLKYQAIELSPAANMAFDLTARRGAFLQGTMRPRTAIVQGRGGQHGAAVWIWMKPAQGSD
jgi:hypothetical protein